MAIEIKVPTVGESITEVFIGEWFADEGEWLETGARCADDTCMQNFEMRLRKVEE